MRMAEERNRSCSLPFHASWPIRTVQRLPYTFADPMPKGKGNTSELVKTQETAPTKTWGCPAASSSPIPSKKQNKREKACESHATSCRQFREAAVLSKNTRSLLPGCFWMVFVITNTSWWGRGGRGQPECLVLSQQPDSRWDVCSRAGICSTLPSSKKEVLQVLLSPPPDGIVAEPR